MSVELEYLAYTCQQVGIQIGFMQSVTPETVSLDKVVVQEGIHECMYECVRSCWHDEGAFHRIEC